jgi:hypothetical protein
MSLENMLRAGWDHGWGWYGMVWDGDIFRFTFKHSLLTMTVIYSDITNGKFEVVTN